MHCSNELRDHLIIIVWHTNVWDINLSSREGETTASPFQLWCKWNWRQVHWKATTTQAPKRECFCRWWPQIIALSFSSVALFFSTVLLFASVLITAVTTRWYLLHRESSFSTIKRFPVWRAWRRYKEMGCGRTRQGLKRAEISSFMCERTGGKLPKSSKLWPRPGYSLAWGPNGLEWGLCS